MLKYSLSLLALLYSLTTYSQNQGSISGKVLDGETGLPLEGANILIDNSNFYSITNEEGFFQINNIPTESYNVTASFIGFKSQTKFNIIVKTIGNQQLEFILNPISDLLDEVILFESPFRTSNETPLSTQTFSAVEIETYPGGNNDITKVVQSLPGISPSIGGFRNDIIIRGGGPNESVYYIDGIEIPNINHFSTQGSSGGPVGLVNISFIKDVTLSTSSFGAEYDNALSGVLSFEQKEANNERIAGNFRLGSSEAGFTFEGPIFDDTSFIFSVRRSYLQFVFKAIGLPFLPDYWDYQLKMNHKIDDYNSINLIGIGSIDKLTINEPEDFDFENQSTIEQIPIINQNSRTLGISWKRIYKNKNGFFNLSISNNRLENEFQRFENNLTKTNIVYSNISTEEESKLRFISNHNSNDLNFSFGGNIQKSIYSNSTIFDFYNVDYDSKIDLLKYGLFLKSSTNLLNDKLGVSFGVRIDQDNFTNNNNLFENFSPRLSLSYNITENNKWKLNFTAGRYFKLPTYTSLGFKDFNDILINKNSKYTRSDHTVLGIEFNNSESSRFTVEAFNKFYNNYPISFIDGVSLANKGGGFEVLGNERVSTSGKGISYGIEFLYQQKLKNNFYGIFSYTFFFSKFSGFDDIYLPSVWDNRNLVSFTGGYKLRKNWELSSKIRFIDNTPYVPLDILKSNQAYPELILDYSELGTKYLDEFLKLDLRVDKRWNFRSISMNLYIDIENILGGNIPVPPEYGLKRDESQNIITPKSLQIIEIDDRSPLIPSIGLVIDF